MNSEHQKVFNFCVFPSNNLRNSFAKTSGRIRASAHDSERGSVSFEKLKSSGQFSVQPKNEASVMSWRSLNLSSALGY